MFHIVVLHAPFLFQLPSVCAFQNAWEAMCGDTSNRWADKSFTAIVTMNGYVGSNNDVSHVSVATSISNDTVNCEHFVQKNLSVVLCW